MKCIDCPSLNDDEANIDVPEYLPFDCICAENNKKIEDVYQEQKWCPKRGER
jgi:hypothetical protein